MNKLPEHAAQPTHLHADMAWWAALYEDSKAKLLNLHCPGELLSLCW